MAYPLSVSPITSPEPDVYCLTVTNKGKNPSPMTIIDVDDRIFYCSDNFFWLDSGESKEVRISTKAGSLGETRPDRLARGILSRSQFPLGTLKPIQYQ